MPTLTLKSLPRKLHAKLKQRASRNRRSLNSEVIACLESSLGSERIEVDSLLVKAQKLRSRIGGNLTPQDLTHFKNQGRP